MGKLHLKEKKNTPEVYLSIEECRFEIKGSSYSDRSYEEIYSKVLKWIDEELIKLECELNCQFFIDIMNSISYKNVMQVMIKLVNLYKTGKNITITWFFEGDDQDNEELAHDMSNLFDIPFIVNAV